MIIIIIRMIMTSMWAGGASRSERSRGMRTLGLGSRRPYRAQAASQPEASTVAHGSRSAGSMPPYHIYFVNTNKNTSRMIIVIIIIIIII